MNTSLLTGRPDDQETHGHTGTRTKAVFTRRQTIEYAVLAVVWVLLSAYFWLWWLRPEHFGNPVLYVGVTLSLLYPLTMLPAFYVFYLGFMRQPVHVAPDELAPGTIGRVAVITLTVPGSESLEHVRRQMLAIANITHPHDSWILVDKKHSPIIQEMAHELGVKYFSRHDAATWGASAVRSWNQPKPPFQSKTKAGNVNAWLDAFGDNYTHFTQLDIDHNPSREYLDRVLGYFGNPRVAWVQAPSVYGNHEHWSARGACEQEFVLQGPLQMGFFGFCRTPFIIGSHCTYDMQAIRKIGGFQPTRAEDHLDTVVLASQGYEGVFVPEVIAVGDGPETFSTYCAQQFAWAYSMIQVLLQHTPRLIRTYSPRKALQFLFVQSWYPCWSLTTMFLFSAPLLSLAADAPISRVGFVDFFLHSLPAAIAATIIWLWSRRWQLPRGVHLSWRGIVLQMARWVTVLSALAQVLLRVKKPYMITSKGVGGTKSLVPVFRTADLAPYAGLALVSTLMCWAYIARIGQGPNQGMMFFALQSALLLWLLIVTVVIQDFFALRRAGLMWQQWLKHRIPAFSIVSTVLMLIIVTSISASDEIWQAVIS